MAFPPHILAERQKTEPKRQEKTEWKRKMMFRHLMRQNQSAERAWQRGRLSGKRHFLSDK
jgi:hypothetical protein